MSAMPYEFMNQFLDPFKKELGVDQMQLQIKRLEKEVQRLKEEAKPRAIYTTEQFAKHFNKDNQWVNRLRKNGLITGSKNGRGYLYTAKELEQFTNDYIAEGHKLTSDDQMQLALQFVNRSKLQNKKHS